MYYYNNLINRTLCFIIFSLLFGSCFAIQNKNYAQGNVLILSNRSPKIVPFDKILHEFGSTSLVIILPKSQYPINLEPNSSKKYARILSLENYFDSASVDLQVINLFESYHFSHVVCLSEPDVLRAARIRDHFNLPGQSYESAIAFRDKIKMKQLLENAGIEVPVYRKVDNIFDVLDFVKEYGYPVIIKPVRGTGSARTVKLDNDNDVMNLSNQGFFSADYLSDLEVETFIDGEMYHVNGVVIDGEIKFSYPSKYIGSLFETTTISKSFGSYILEYENPLTHELKQYTAKVLKALPTPENTAFHLEVFKERKSGKLIFCEIASRVGGGYVREDLINAFGCDLGKIYLRLSAGLPPEINFEDISQKPKKILGWTIFPKRKGKVVSIPSKIPFEWVISYDVHVKINEKLSNPKHVLDDTISIYFQGNSEREIRERHLILEDWVSKNLKISFLKNANSK